MAHIFMKNYELIEHTADIGIKVKGKDMKDLFINAALAMFEIIAERTNKTPSDKKTIVIKQKAENIEELFINWLNELLSLHATRNKIFCEINFKNLDENNLDAEITGCNINDYKIKAEIKAATYHELEINRVPSGWEAKVIFDV